MQDANNIFMVSFVVLALFFAHLFLTEKKKEIINSGWNLKMPYVTSLFR